MKKYKIRLILFMLVLSIFLVMSGCGDDEESDQPADTSPSVEGEEPHYNTEGSTDEFWERFNNGEGEVHTFNGEEGSGEFYLPEE